MCSSDTIGVLPLMGRASIELGVSDPVGEPHWVESGPRATRSSGLASPIASPIGPKKEENEE